MPAPPLPIPRITIDMFNSPIDWCPVCRKWVALDEPCPQGALTRACRIERARHAVPAPPAREPRIDVLPGVPM
jgi:hypothetical protein